MGHASFEWLWLVRARIAGWRRCCIGSDLLRRRCNRAFAGGSRRAGLAAGVGAGHDLLVGLWLSERVIGRSVCAGSAFRRCCRNADRACAVGGVDRGWSRGSGVASWCVGCRSSRRWSDGRRRPALRRVAGSVHRALSKASQLVAVLVGAGSGFGRGLLLVGPFSVPVMLVGRAARGLRASQVRAQARCRAGSQVSPLGGGWR